MKVPKKVELPILAPEGRRSEVAGVVGPQLPRWLKRNLPPGGGFGRTREVLRKLGLETVCENSLCPNRAECFAHHTATFMILGNVCTRPCGFCAVQRGRPQPPDPDEPRRVAQAARTLGLRHVVITSVTRDDLPDGGAEHFYRTVQEVRSLTGATVEVLTPDFIGKPEALERVLQARPEVFNHNTETVPRLYAQVRGPKSRYWWTLEVLRRAAQSDPNIKVKSGLMLGLGETRQELVEVMCDLLRAGCRLLTLGQYLQPGPGYLPVVRYLPPEEFEELGQLARRLGFEHVSSGPFVRSSYHAWEAVQGS